MASWRAGRISATPGAPDENDDLTSLIPRASTRTYPGTILQTITKPHVNLETFLEIIELDSVKTAYDFSRPICEEVFLQADTGLNQARSDL